ncbi:MAG: hypothetical protein KAT11_01000 [Phycisphaerae bacterium]|nr:hypothetical protein [Phycisphaerae bacterium]
MLEGKRSKRTMALRMTAAAYGLAVAVVFAVVGTIHLESKATVEGQINRSYEVSLPEGWERYLSVGKLTVIGEPFYGIRHKSFGLCPVLRVQWSLENLSSEPLYFKMNYRGKNPAGPGGTGFGVGYVLDAHECRTIEDIVPVFSAKVAAPLKIYLIKLWTPKERLEPTERHVGVTIGPLKATGLLTNDLIAGNERNTHFNIKQVQLTHSKAKGNMLKATVSNKTNDELQLAVQVAVGDPAKADFAQVESLLMKSKGSFTEATVTINPHRDTTINVPYTVPSDAGSNPLLAFRLFELTETLAPALIKSLSLTERDMRHYRSTRLVYWGRFDLLKAADKGLASLPSYVPVEERAKLTGEKRSKHLVFRYRPNSYAARNINEAIKNREEAYDKLSSTLRMELPRTVRIDLYPDMESKALGSGTKWTPANTVTGTHIAEVCNEGYQCDPYHELAHIFSFHFGGATGGLCEAFAVYFEPNNMTVDACRERVLSELSEGKLQPLREILRTEGTTNANVLLVHYLLNRDLNKFKNLYVATTRAKDMEELEKAIHEIYGTDTEGLEQQWLDWLRK